MAGNYIGKEPLKTDLKSESDAVLVSTAAMRMALV